MTTYSPIQVTGAYTISQNPTYTGSNNGNGAYSIAGSETALTLLGNLTVQDNTANVFLSAVNAVGLNPQFTVMGASVMTVTDTGAGSTAFGFFSSDVPGFADTVLFFNEGTYSVTSAGNANGAVMATSTGSVAASSFSNGGTFTVSAQGGYAVGFGATSQAGAENGGVMNISGETEAIAFDLLQGGTVTNAGTITATSSGGPADGILVGAGATTITNTGTINAHYAIDTSMSDTAAMSVTNSGVINGEVFFGASPGNSLVNTGAINGQVHFEGTSGEQTYDGRGGNLSGEVDFNTTAGATGVDVVHLGNDGEWAYGGAAAFIAFGGSGADTIVGGTGNDYIDGRGGADILTGGGGHDTFVMDSNVGADEITDFNTAADVIDISAFASQFTSLAQVLAASTQVGSDTTIQLNGSSSVTLDGVSKASLTASDFSFTHIAPPVSTVHDPLNIDGTGYDGIIFRDSSTGDMGYMTANASGGETWHATGPTGTTYASLGVGDFNGDGISDVAFRDSAGDWGFMSVNPGGGETWHGVGSTSTAYSVAGVGDFGGTGQSDIAFVNPTTGDFGYMSVTSSGAEQWHALGPTSTAYTAYGAGDFLGNDSIGVLFRNNTTGDMGFMTANTSGGETWHAIGPTGTGYAVLGVGDFDGSGQDEVAFRNTSTGDWGYMTANASGSGETWHDVGNAELDYAVLKVGDFDNSGHDEIAFRSTSSGAWGYMSVNAGGGETWHAIGSTSLDYYAV